MVFKATALVVPLTERSTAVDYYKFYGQLFRASLRHVAHTSASVSVAAIAFAVDDAVINIIETYD